MKKTVRGTITYKAPPVIRQMKTKQRLEQFIDVDIYEPEPSRQQFIFYLQDPDDLDWWSKATDVEISYWPYHYVKTDFPIKAIKASSVRELTYKEVQEIMNKYKAIAKQQKAERMIKHREDEKKRIEQRKQQREELRKNPVEWAEEDW